MAFAARISEDFLEEEPATTPYGGLSDADARCISATLAVLEDPAVAHPAAALAAILRHFSGADEPAVALSLAADELKRIAKDGVRAAVVDLGVL